jgi:hypothetical protein
VTHLKFVLQRKSCFAEHARCHCEHLQNLPCSVIVTLVKGTGVIFQALNIVVRGCVSDAVSGLLVTVRRTRAGHLCNGRLDMLYSEACRNTISAKGMRSSVGLCRTIAAAQLLFAFGPAVHTCSAESEGSARL